jgi:hypothetical protein
MIFYYLGGEVNALYREGPVAYHGQTALERLRSQVTGEDGMISVYELPLDMAHLLRGITNRQKLKETLKGSGELNELLRRMEKSEHTGTLEIQTTLGAAMILFVRGRVSNTYWEAAGGLTFEKGEARQRLEEGLGRGSGTLYLADFSREVWKGRHEVTGPTRSRLERPEEEAAVDLIAMEEMGLRREVLAGLLEQVPSVLQVFFFDLLTGAVYAREGRGAADVRVGPLAEKVPELTRDLRARTQGPSDDEGLEFLELATQKVSVLVAVVPEALEAIAILADRSQPTSLIGAALAQAVATYAARLHPSRRKVGV